eukprot:9489996-Pyramimonas_sp.AAC.1
MEAVPALRSALLALDPSSIKAVVRAALGTAMEGAEGVMRTVAEMHKEAADEFDVIDEALATQAHALVLASRDNLKVGY